MIPSIFDNFLLPGSQYCESLILSPEHSWKGFANKRDDKNLDSNDAIDTCCHSLIECDESESFEWDQPTDWNFSDCNCVNEFQKCLQNLNAPLANELVLHHFLNTTQCYINYHPIVKCDGIWLYPISNVTRNMYLSMNITEIENRCSAYEFDKSQPKKIQVVDFILTQRSHGHWRLLAGSHYFGYF